jgi:hypothetical protein
MVAWAAIAIGSPIAGLVTGPWLRRSLSRKAILTLSIMAGVVAAAAFTPVSLAGVLADHVALMASYAWMWILVGMARSRLLRAVLVALPLLLAIWIASGDSFFMAIVPSDLTRLPTRTMSIGCGWTTRTIRLQRYGWVAHSGYELTVASRPRGLPIELQLDRRQFDDGEYEDAELFSMRRVGPSGCSTVVAYDGNEQWRVD